MYIIQKSVIVPPDRHLHLDLVLPEEIPIGENEMSITFYPARKKDVDLMQFAGCLKDSKIFEGDPVEIQRKMRDEWR